MIILFLFNCIYTDTALFPLSLSISSNFPSLLFSLLRGRHKQVVPDLSKHREGKKVQGQEAQSLTGSTNSNDTGDLKGLCFVAAVLIECLVE